MAAEHNPTCVITGKKDNLKMHPLRDLQGNMIGWVFFHESVQINSISGKMNWNFDVVVDHKDE